jgi:hypothetical protein
MSVISAMFYLFIGLTGYSVDPEISCELHKLPEHPELKKKKKCGSLNWTRPKEGSAKVNTNGASKGNLDASGACGYSWQ